MLYVVAMLALMAAAVQSLLLSSTALDKRVWDRAQADAILDAAMARVVLGISDARSDQRWRVDGSKEHFDFTGAVVTAAVQDQFGLIDLNAADGSMLKRLMQACGVQEELAAELTNRILDWRRAGDSASLERDADYTAAGLPYRPRHGPFQSVGELRLVLGMTVDLYKQMERALTVHSGHPSFEPSTAPETALRALYLENPDQVARILAERRQREGAERPGTLASTYALGGRTFGVNLAARLDGRSYKRQIVIMLTEDDKRPYIVLAWN